MKAKADKKKKVLTPEEKEELKQQQIQKRKAIQERNSKRIWEIDFLRGIIIIGMIIDHAIFNFRDVYTSLFYYNIPGSHPEFFIQMHQFASVYYVHPVRTAIRLIGVALLFLLSGISCKFAKSNWKRGLMIVIVGIVFTLGVNLYALFFDRSMFMFNSIISTFGLCILFYVLFKYLAGKLLPKIKWKWICLALTGLFFVIWVIVSWWNYTFVQGKTDYWPNCFFVFSNQLVPWYMGLEHFRWEDLPKIFFGLEGFGFDWLGLFPYIFYMFLGGFIGETVYADRISIIKYFYPKEMRTAPNFLETPLGKKNASIIRHTQFIITPGRHTLFIYFFHQPVIILIFSIIALCCGMRFTF